MLATFNVTSTRGKKEATVFGCRIYEGELTTKTKYQVIRDGELLKDNLTLSSLRHHKTTVQQMSKGNECGLIFDSHRDLDLQKGDVIEAYTEHERAEPKFNHKPGVTKSF